MMIKVVGIVCYLVMIEYACTKKWGNVILFCYKTLKNRQWRGSEVYIEYFS